jgi:CPA1 family monovalent cation:H+ antiporter
LHARQAALREVTKRLEKAIKDHELPAEAADHLRTRNQSRLQILPTNLTEGLEQMRKTAALKIELIDAEREFIYQLLRDGKLTDEARRRIEYELDLEEAGVANRGKDGGGWM